MTRIPPAEGYKRIAAEEGYAPPFLIDAWTKMLREGTVDDPSFVSLHGFYLLKDAPRATFIRDALQDVGAGRIADMDAAGIDKRVHPHGLRHTMAYELLMEGVPAYLDAREVRAALLDLPGRRRAASGWCRITGITPTRCGIARTRRITVAVTWRWSGIPVGRCLLRCNLLRCCLSRRCWRRVRCRRRIRYRRRRWFGRRRRGRRRHRRSRVRDAADTLLLLGLHLFKTLVLLGPALLPFFLHLLTPLGPLLGTGVILATLSTPSLALRFHLASALLHFGLTLVEIKEAA